MNRYGESKKLFQTPLLGAAVGILDLIPLVTGEFSHRDSTHLPLSCGVGTVAGWIHLHHSFLG